MADEIDEPDELLDLVDEHDEVIGTLRREDILSLEVNKQGFARGVGVFIANDMGKLWVPQRSKQRKVAPGGLDFSAGEHVTHGETYEAAAIRGLQEETHLRPEPDQLAPVGSVSPSPGMPYFHHIFTYRTNEIPDYNRSDFSDYEWLSPQELDDKLSHGEPAKKILQPSVRLLLQHMQTKGGIS